MSVFRFRVTLLKCALYEFFPAAFKAFSEYAQHSDVVIGHSYSFLLVGHSVVDEIFNGNVFHSKSNEVSQFGGVHNRNNSMLQIFNQLGGAGDSIDDAVFSKDKAIMALVVLGIELGFRQRPNLDIFCALNAVGPSGQFL